LFRNTFSKNARKMGVVPESAAHRPGLDHVDGHMMMDVSSIMILQVARHLLVQIQLQISQTLNSRQRASRTPKKSVNARRYLTGNKPITFSKRPRDAVKTSVIFSPMASPEMDASPLSPFQASSLSSVTKASIPSPSQRLSNADIKSTGSIIAR
jgi:hypothetical protein